MKNALIGIVIGVAGKYAVSRLTRRVLFELDARASGVQYRPLGYAAARCSGRVVAAGATAEED